MPPSKPHLARKQSNAAIQGKLLLKSKSSQHMKNTVTLKEEAAKESSEPTLPPEEHHEVIKLLTAENTHIIREAVVYSTKEMGYIPIPEINHLAIHLSIKSILVYQGDKEPKETTPEPQHVETTHIEAKSERTSPVSPGMEGELVEEARDAATPPRPQHGKKLANQFNFCERGVLTVCIYHKDEEVQTKPPLKVSVMASASQWSIYDYYLKTKRENEKKSKDDESQAVVRKTCPGLSSLRSAVRVAERMINQNIFDEIIQDFKYWEDASDEYKQGLGSLLPLWNFTYDDVRGLTVTTLSWNTFYDDLFVIGYGTHDCTRHLAHGKLCVFSLTNPSHPEWVFQTESGVTHVDFHPHYPHFLVVGFQNGHIAVYDLSEPCGRLRACSTLVNGKHVGPVWEVGIGSWNR